jgi:hypothetical protein
MIKARQRVAIYLRVSPGSNDCPAVSFAALVQGRCRRQLAARFDGGIEGPSRWSVGSTPTARVRVFLGPVRRLVHAEGRRVFHARLHRESFSIPDLVRIAQGEIPGFGCCLPATHQQRRRQSSTWPRAPGTSPVEASQNWFREQDLSGPNPSIGSDQSPQRAQGRYLNRLPRVL